MYHFIKDPTLPQNLKPQTMVILTKLNKDFLLYNGICHVTIRGLGWSFSRIGKHIERCLQTISMTNITNQ
jgi:uncharacterized alpha-E superfamily protein